MSDHQLEEESESEGEFLWLISLSDLMILLFVFFVVLFSVTYKNMSPQQFEEAVQVIRGEQSPSTLDEIQRQLIEWLKQKELMEQVKVQQEDDALLIQIREKILFEQGQYDLKEVNSELMKVLRTALQLIPQPYRIGIEGHTDDTPLNQSSFFLHNWDLAARRASSVLSALELPEALLKRAIVMGFGSTKPIKANRDEDGGAIESNQAENRRVTIRIF